MHLTSQFVEKFELFADNLEIFNSSYEQYRIRQREFDLEMRKINQEKTLVSGVANSGGSAVGGAIAGGPWGALAGFGLGVLGGVGNYYIEGHYGDKEQKATESLYRRQIPDQITTGSGTWFSYQNFCGFFEYIWPDSDWMNQLSNGWIVEANVRNFNDVMQILQNSTKKEYLKAEVDVRAGHGVHLSREIRDAIRERFLKGIWFL